MSARPCRYAGDQRPRLTRAHLAGCEVPACGGCEPCPERHCGTCGHRHVTVDGQGADQTCGDCLHATREALEHIGHYAARMLGEAILRGINSHAAMLAGPTANPEAWGYRRMSAIAGRIDAAWLDDCQDEQHPAWVVGTWEILARDHLHQPRDYDPTLTEARGYLDRQLHHLAHDDEFDFPAMHHDLIRCARHLEETLRDGDRPQRGATCPACGRADLEKHYGDTETDDRWTCPRCRQQWTEHDYRTRIAGLYIGVAPALTASQIRQAYRVPEATVRSWAQRGRVTKRGKDNQGRMLYDVAQVLACRDEQATAWADLG